MKIGKYEIGVRKEIKDWVYEHDKLALGVCRGMIIAGCGLIYYGGYVNGKNCYGEPISEAAKMIDDGRKKGYVYAVFADEQNDLSQIIRTDQLTDELKHLVEQYQSD